MVTFEKVAILAALASRTPKAEQIGSATVGERTARVARLCEEWSAEGMFAHEERNEASRKIILDRMTELANSIGLVVAEKENGELWVGRADYMIKMIEDRRHRRAG